MEHETVETVEQEQPTEQQEPTPPVEEPAQEPPQQEPDTPAKPTLAELLTQNADYQSQYDAMLNEQPELKPILQAIIASQEKGVMEMKRLMHCLNCC